MARPNPIDPDNMVEVRRQRLEKLLDRYGGKNAGTEALHKLSGLSFSFFLKFRRGVMTNPTIRSLEKLDRAMLQLEDQIREGR